jgi:hypothetical protein
MPGASGVCDDASQRATLGDASTDTGSDGAPLQSCLGPIGTAPRLVETFDTFGWKAPAGTWTVSAGEALSTKADTYTYAYPDAVLPDDYRVATTVRQIEHTDTASAYEIAFRIQGTGEMLHCNWQPNDQHIVLQRTNGASVGMPSMVDTMVEVPRYDPHALTLGSRSAAAKQCCVRGSPTPDHDVRALPLRTAARDQDLKMQAAYHPTITKARACSRAVTEDVARVLLVFFQACGGAWR